MAIQGIIFANIYDSSLGELTNKRTMASLPYGGRYRQIDFTLSNMSNAGIRRIGIISRYNYQSLMAHIGSGDEWDLALEEGGLEYLTPFSLGYGTYHGKIEALNSVKEYLEFGNNDDYVVLADSSVLCNVDLHKVIEAHIASGKDLTVMVKDGIANGRKLLDLCVTLDENGEINDMAVDYVGTSEYLASMGLFIIDKKTLMEQVEECVARDCYRLERDMILRLWNKGKLSVNAYQFKGAALFNESTEEYFQNNLALLRPEVRQSLFDPRPIYTKVRDRVPTYYGEESSISDCIVADGCMLEGDVRNSVLFRQVEVEAGAHVDHCLIMNDARIGAGCDLQYVILDKNVTVHPGAKLIGTEKNPIIIKRGETV